MAATQLWCILTILSLIVVCCNSQSYNSSVSSVKLQISPDSLSSMKYGNFHIEIYEHSNNQKVTASEKKYFYSPIALLDHKSVASRLNRFTKQPEMRFRIEMWNDKVENEVVQHLNQIVGQEIKPNKVRVIPFEKVILTSKLPTADYLLSPVWTPYDKSKTLRLSLSCYDQKICDEVAEEMRSDPEQFHHFKLLYSLSSQTSLTKETTITFESVTSSQMVADLLHKFGDKTEVFLTVNDEKKMLTEISNKILMDTFNDSEIGTPDTDIQIYNILKDFLVTSKTTIKEKNDKKWDSVFWNEENYRPDRTATTLNEIINQMDTGTQKKLANMFQKAKKQSGVADQLSSSYKTRQDEQLRQGNQTNDKNENEIRRSQTADQDRFIQHNQIEKWELAKNYSGEQNRNISRIQHNYNASGWADVEIISSVISEKISNNSDNSQRAKIFKDDVEKLLEESRNHVQWDEDKFVPKPMQLSRINLGQFRDSQLFQDRKIRVRYMDAEHSVPIKFVEHPEITVTDEWNDLKDELNDTRELLKTTAINLAKTNTELSNVKKNLTSTEIDLTNKLEVTNLELEKTKIELKKKADNVDDLSTKLFATEKELAEMNIRTGNLSSELKATSQRLALELKISEDNLRKELRATLNHLETATTNLNATRTELSSTKSAFADWTTKLNANSQRLVHELKVTEDNMRKELKTTLNNLETATTYLASTRTELNSTQSAIVDLTSTLNARTSEIIDIGKMPASCSDLQRMGHKLSGFFSVKGLTKMEMVHCDFNLNQNDKQKWIGYADVKSTPVHFYVQRSSSTSRESTPIPYDLARLNVGNAMDLKTGIFTAPQPGTYFFSFTGHAKFPSSSSESFYAGLYLNGSLIGRSSIKGSAITDQRSPLTIQLTLNLKKGDQVWATIQYDGSGKVLYDNSDHYTHFTGFMLEEEIVASL